MSTKHVSYNTSSLPLNVKSKDRTCFYYHASLTIIVDVVFVLGNVIVIMAVVVVTLVFVIDNMYVILVIGVLS